jgi:hypothetical protein
VPMLLVIARPLDERSTRRKVPAPSAFSGLIPTSLSLRILLAQSVHGFRKVLILLVPSLTPLRRRLPRELADCELATIPSVIAVLEVALR